MKKTWHEICSKCIHGVYPTLSQLQGVLICFLTSCKLMESDPRLEHVFLSILGLHWWNIIFLYEDAWTNDSACDFCRFNLVLRQLTGYSFAISPSSLTFAPDFYMYPLPSNHPWYQTPGPNTGPNPSKNETWSHFKGLDVQYMDPTSDDQSMISTKYLTSIIRN